MPSNSRPYQNIWGNVKIGQNTKIGAYVELGDGVEIGDNCTIQAKVFIPPGWKIGNNVFIGPGVMFANDKYPKAQGQWEKVQGEVMDGVSIGMGAMIGPGLTIGRNVMIGMGSVVIKSILQGETWYGNPARKAQ